MKKIVPCLIESLINLFIRVSLPDVVVFMSLDTRKTDFVAFENNTGADQLSHLRKLISAFVIYLLQSMMSKLASYIISTF